MAVYFIRAGEDGPVKIGVAGNPQHRLKNLQSGSPDALTIFRLIEGDETTEREMHKRFGPLRLRGEWFQFTEEMLSVGNPVEIRTRRSLPAIEPLADTASLTEQAIHAVRSARRTLGWNLSEMARAAGVRESTIRKIDEPTWNPEINTLRKLEQAIAAAQ